MFKIMNGFMAVENYDYFFDVFGARSNREKSMKSITLAKIGYIILLTILRKKLLLFRLIKTLQTKLGFMFISEFFSALTFSRFFGDYNFCCLKKFLNLKDLPIVAKLHEKEFKALKIFIKNV